jgi:hypothetical protein
MALVTLVEGRQKMYNWNNWYAGWGSFLWIAVWFLIFASVGNWGYSYQTVAYANLIKLTNQGIT